MRRLMAAVALLCVAVSLVGLAPMTRADDGVPRGQWYLHDYGFDRVWRTTRGEGVVVAVIDSGVDGRHRDLRGALVRGTDLTGTSDDGQVPVGPETAKPHGTAVASLIVGQGPPGSKRVAGVAPGAKVMPIAMLTNVGESGDQIYDAVPVAIRYAVDHGADVVNISLGEGMDRFNPFFRSWTDALAYAAAHDVVVVASVGNEWGSPVGGPANMASVVGVGSVGIEGTVSKGVSTYGPRVAIAAPGSTSQCPRFLDSTNDPCLGYPAAVPDGGYVAFTGSSGASPIVAGTAALVIAAHPGIAAADVVNRLVSTARNPAGPGERTPGLGFGVVDPVAAVTADVPYVEENPLGVPKGTAAYVAQLAGSASSSASSSASPPGSSSDAPTASTSADEGDTPRSSPAADDDATARVSGLVAGGVAVLVLLVAVVVGLRWRRTRRGP